MLVWSCQDEKLYNWLPDQPVGEELPDIVITPAALEAATPADLDPTTCGVFF